VSWCRVDRVWASGLRHAPNLTGLWSTAIVLNALNFGVSLMIVAAAPARVFAAYVIGQSLVQLVSALADGGMAGSIQIIAAKENADATLLDALRRVTTRNGAGFAAVSILVIVALSRVPSFLGTHGGVQIPPILLVLCALTGIVQARQSVSSALIYSVGQFRPYSVTQLIPPVARLVVVSGMLLTHSRVTAPLLVLNDLSAGMIGWLYGNSRLRQFRTHSGAGSRSERAPELGSAARHMLRSGFVPTFLSALGLQMVVLGGGVFASGIALGTYGVFLRASQIIKVVVDPFMGYGARRLRLTEVGNRRRAELYFIALTLGAYMSMAGFVFVLYVGAGRFLHHYSLGYTAPLAVFLIANIFGGLYLAINSVLLSRGYVDHRLKGAVLQLGASMLFVFLVRPSTVWQLVLSMATAVVPTFVYYSWVGLRGAGDRHEFGLSLSDAKVSARPPRAAAADP
jgi:hypothetical protein